MIKRSNARKVWIKCDWGEYMSEQICRTGEMMLKASRALNVLSNVRSTVIFLLPKIYEK